MVVALVSGGKWGRKGGGRREREAKAAGGKGGEGEGEGNALGVASRQPIAHLADP